MGDGFSDPDPADTGGGGGDSADDDPGRPPEIDQMDLSEEVYATPKRSCEDCRHAAVCRYYLTFADEGPIDAEDLALICAAYDPGDADGATATTEN